MFIRMWHSFSSAGRGLKQIFVSEPNFRLQVLLGLVVLVLSWYFPLKNWERILMIILVMAVLVMEILNSTFEYLSDLLKPRLHHYVRTIKDIMAGGVLLTAVGAAVIGLMIFVPYFLQVWK